MSDNEDFFAPPKQGDIVGGRYALTDPATGEARRYTRVTTHASALSDSYGITTWSQRELVRGLSLRHDLRLQTASLPSEATNAQLDEVRKAALDAAASSAKATVGTAIHAALLDGDLCMTPEFDDHTACFQAALAEHGFRISATEFLCINNKLGTAGRADMLLAWKGGAGKRKIGDVKTGRLHGGHEFAIQLATYASSDYFELDGEWVPASHLNIDQDEAIVFHVDPETGATAVYTVDLVQGRYAANLATKVRAWRNTKALLLPLVTTKDSWTPETKDARDVDNRNSDPALPAQLAGAADLADRVAAWPLDDEDGTGAQDVPRGSTGLPAAGSGPAIDPGAGDPWSDSDELSSTASDAVQPATVPAPTGDGPAELGANGLPDNQPAASAGPTELGPKARLMTQSKATLQQILRDLGCGDVLHQRNWLADKILELRAQPPVAEVPGILASIKIAASSRALAGMWTGVTAHGLHPERWTHDMQEAGRERLAELDAAAPRIENPFE